MLPSGHFVLRSLSVLALSFSLATLSACSKSRGSGAGSEDGVGELAVQDLELANQQRYGEGNIPKAVGGGAFPDIHFAYDSAVVPSEYHADIRRLAQALQGDNTMHAEVEGHCDKRGTNEYNLALGEERAKAVAKLLVSFGARPEQISTVSYGEEIPLDPSDTEEAYAKNRRAHFALYSKDRG